MGWRIRVPALTFVFLAFLDVFVVGVLKLSEDIVPQLRPLRDYFEYGRSVPGKMQVWLENPSAAGNLFEVGWIQDGIDVSAKQFLREVDGGEPVIRAYGMSFVNNIVNYAATKNPELQIDLHAGPGAPPNFSYAFFLDDSANRREGDVVVLGILSSAVPGLAAMSNRTWVFEQPAPFTYPIFRLTDAGKLLRIDPLVNSSTGERALANNPTAQAAWYSQLQDLDAFFSPVTFGAKSLDHSPFARLVRRSLALDLIERRKRQLQDNESIVIDPLRQMIVEFAEKAREENLFPVVFLIQTNDATDLDLLDVLGPVLKSKGIPYLSTAEHFDPRDVSGFLADGHYKKEVDLVFAEKFLEILRYHGILRSKQ